MIVKISRSLYIISIKCFKFVCKRNLFSETPFHGGPLFGTDSLMFTREILASSVFSVQVSVPCENAEGLCLMLNFLDANM